MHADGNNPLIRRYREIRERERQVAIIRNQIKTANPTLTPKQVDEIMKGHLKFRK
jgi:hypothetical protein